jgi:hypothetical protein
MSIQLVGTTPQRRFSNTTCLLTPSRSSTTVFIRASLSTASFDDVCLCSLVRSGSESAANYKDQLSFTPSDLVANWGFDEASGSTALDSVGGRTLALGGGAAFTADIHP